MFESCIEKQNRIRAHFSSCRSEEEKYGKIIEMGKELPHLDPLHKTLENLVQGCQSTMYLKTFADLNDNSLHFQADSNALISAGLAALLIFVYSGESATTILQCKPSYLEDLGIHANLSPSRASGLYSIHLRMKQEALKHLTSTLQNF
jgi:cysteine desulfuration protein SufE